MKFHLFSLSLCFTVFMANLVCSEARIGSEMDHHDAHTKTTTTSPVFHLRRSVNTNIFQQHQEPHGNKQGEPANKNHQGDQVDKKPFDHGTTIVDQYFSLTRRRGRSSGKKENRFGSVSTQVIVHGLDRDPSMDDIVTIDQALVASYNQVHDRKGDTRFRMINFKDQTLETHKESVSVLNRKNQNSPVATSDSASAPDSFSPKFFNGAVVELIENYLATSNDNKNHDQEIAEMTMPMLGYTKERSYSLLWLYLDGYFGFECYLCTREDDDPPYMLAQTNLFMSNLATAKDELQDAFCDLLRKSGRDNFAEARDCFIIFNNY